MKFDDLNSYELPPEGSHVGVLVGWIDRGMQPGKYGARRQVSARFELPEIETESGEPSLVFVTIFNLSMRSKIFREMACCLLGTTDLKGADVSEMMGKACKLGIVHTTTNDGQTFANVAGFAGLKRGVAVPQTDTEPVYYSLDPADVPDLATLDRATDALSESERARVQASQTYKDLRAMLKHVRDSKGKPATELIQDGFPEGLG